jgi:hypothetical protein
MKQPCNEPSEQPNEVKSLLLRYKGLVKSIVKEQEARGDGTPTKTLGDLARERLRDIEHEKRSEQNSPEGSAQTGSNVAATTA